MSDNRRRSRNGRGGYGLFSPAGNIGHGHLGVPHKYTSDASMIHQPPGPSSPRPQSLSMSAPRREPANGWGCLCKTPSMSSPTKFSGSGRRKSGMPPSHNWRYNLESGLRSRTDSNNRLTHRIQYSPLAEQAVPRAGTEDTLLSTPFRYPPLPYGSRFGRRHEHGIYYGSKRLDTNLA